MAPFLFSQPLKILRNRISLLIKQSENHKFKIGNRFHKNEIVFDKYAGTFYSRQKNCLIINMMHISKARILLLTNSAPSSSNNNKFYSVLVFQKFPLP